MAQKGARPSDMIGVVATIDPDAYAAGTHESDWVSLADHNSIMAVVMAGILGASATLDAKLEQAKSAAGLDAKDVPNSSITQLTKAGSDDDKQAIINMFAEDIDAENGFTHVRLSITVGTATSDAGGIILSNSQRYGLATDRDLSTVDEVVDAG